MAFSLAEGRKLQYEWSTFASNYKVNGLAVWTRVFQKHPQYQKLFKAYAPKDWEGLANNVRLMCHGQYVMKQVGKFVEAASDELKLKAELMRMGGEHTQRKVQPEHFANIFPIIIDQLVITNGGRLTRDLWLRFFKHCSDGMSDGLKHPVPAPPTPSEEALRDVFVEWDSDHSGALDHEEMFHVMQNMVEDMSEAKIREMIAQADVDKDGQIQFDEFLNIFRDTRILEESPISKADLRVLQYEWKEFATNYRVNGIVVFTTLFRRYPDYQKLFMPFAPEAWEDLAGNVRLMCHSQYVMKNIGQSLEIGDNAKALETHLQKLGGEHTERGLSGKMFRNFYDIVIDQLVVVNGGKLHRQLWKHFFDYCQALMAKGLRQPVKPPVTPSEEAIRDIFLQWDTDRDGALNADELMEVMQNLSPDTEPAKIKKMITNADTNKDGVIQFDEFLAVFRQTRK